MSLYGIFCNHFSTRWCEFKDDLIWRFFTGQSDLEDWNSKEDRMYEYMDIKFYISLVLIYISISWPVSLVFAPAG